jgi:hypothetical protein
MFFPSALLCAKVFAFQNGAKPDHRANRRCPYWISVWGPLRMGSFEWSMGLLKNSQPLANAQKNLAQSSAEGYIRKLFIFRKAFPNLRFLRFLL